MPSPEEAKTIYALHKFEMVDVQMEAGSSDNGNGSHNDARPSMLSVPSSLHSQSRKQVKVTITSQTDTGDGDLNMDVYRGMRKSMAENVLAKKAVEFHERWCNHLLLSNDVLLPASGVEIDPSYR